MLILLWTSSLQFSEDQFTLCDKESHNAQCLLLKGSSAAEAAEKSKEYGINRDALLNELK